MKIVGIDPSFTGFGISNEHATIAVAAVGDTIRLRCKSLKGALLQFVSPWRGDRMLWVIEKPMPTERNVMHLYNMGHLMSHVYDLADELTNVTILEVPAGTLKIFACGRGNANKTDIALAVFDRWQMRFDNDRGGNKYDAFALYQFGLAYQRGENPGVRPSNLKKGKGMA